jgi:hypothetical protein
MEYIFEVDFLSIIIDKLVCVCKINVIGNQIISNKRFHLSMFLFSRDTFFYITLEHKIIQ